MISRIMHISNHIILLKLNSYEFGMMDFTLETKLYHATITQIEPLREECLSVDSNLMKAVGLTEFEKIYVCNVNNGKYFETYVTSAKTHSGIIQLNGDAAQNGAIGDKINVFSYHLLNIEDQNTSNLKIAILSNDNKIKHMIKMDPKVKTKAH